MPWFLEIGYVGAGPGVVEEYAVKTEAEAAAKCQAACDRYNGWCVEGTVKEGYFIDWGRGYIRVIRR